MLILKVLQTREIGAAKSDGCKKTKVGVSFATQAMLASHSVQINSSILRKAWEKYVDENDSFYDFYLATITIPIPLLSYDYQIFTARK